MRAIGQAGTWLPWALLLCACARAPESVPVAVERPIAAVPAPTGRPAPGETGNVTVSDGGGDVALNWRAPVSTLDEAGLAAARRDAAQALAEDRLYREARDAIPLYLSILALRPDDAAAARGLARARARLLRQGSDALDRVGLQSAAEDIEALAIASEVAAVVRTLARGRDEAAEAAEAYLARLDQIERVAELNATGEHQVRTGALGEAGGGALASFRDALRLAPAQPRALRGLETVEAAFIQRAEEAAAASNFPEAARWLQAAAKVRALPPDGPEPEPGEAAVSPVEQARQRVEAVRRSRLAALRTAGIADMAHPLGLRAAREKLAEALRIAEPGDDVAADFRRRVDLATHYGVFRPGQVFSDAFGDGARGPQMVVVPHGGFRMGAAEGEPGSSDSERPAHYVRFDRGFAISRTEVTVGDFRRFIEATGHRARATRRGHSIVYDERSGNFVRRSGVDWRSDYAGAPAADDLPVLHVSVRDAEAYAEWLSVQTGRNYRLPSEAEFEYALRAGGQGRYPWGDAGTPPRDSGNVTGGHDVSPGGRHWNNAFVGYGDGHWGPAPVARFEANPWGVHDLAGNVSEWVADCWHASYRRAPVDGVAWYNPGCRSRVVRGGSWAGAPHQARSAWRYATDSDLTNARVGFRLVRGI